MRGFFAPGVALLAYVAPLGRMGLLALLIALPALGALYLPDAQAWREPTVMALYALALYFTLSFVFLRSEGIRRTTEVIERFALGDLTARRDAQSARDAAGM
jgi:hypothetical protein